MTYQRSYQSFSWHSPSQGKSAQFAPPSSIIQARQNPSTPPSQAEIENKAFDQNKFEAFGLQLKEKSGSITPVEQARLGVLQAKLDNFWAPRVARAARFGHNFATIPVHAPGQQGSAPVQPKLAIQPYRALRHLQQSEAVIQRVGPNGQKNYVEAEGVHLDKHLTEWTYYLPEVTSVGQVRGIAREIFNGITDQYDWKPSGDNATFDSKYKGYPVRLVWSREGRGITTCFIQETRLQSAKRIQAQQGFQQPHQGFQQPQQALQQPYQGFQQPQQALQQPVFHNGYYWTPDYSYWFDPVSNQWRARM